MKIYYLKNKETGELVKYTSGKVPIWQSKSEIDNFMELNKYILPDHEVIEKEL